MPFPLVWASRILTRRGTFARRASIPWKRDVPFTPSNAGLKDLKIEIHNYLERRCNVCYDPDHEIMVTVGGSEAIDAAMRAMIDPGR